MPKKMSAKPRNFLKKLFLSTLINISAGLTIVYTLVFTSLVLRKTYIGSKAVREVRGCMESVSKQKLENSSQFQDFLNNLRSRKRPPAIFLLNQYALNMTNNFLCNTEVFENVHDRFVFVTLDKRTFQVLSNRWPRVELFQFSSPALWAPFSFAESHYQLIYLLRANLASLLSKHGLSFWMMQQDTFWRRNFFDLNLENSGNFDILFDQLGDTTTNSKRNGWLNGANFYVRGSNRTERFFDGISDILERHYIPDMGKMVQQCLTWGEQAINCQYMPHKIAHSWEWMYTNQTDPPVLMQLDCETDGRTKLQELGKFGFHFLNNDYQSTCNWSSVQNARYLMERGKIETKMTGLSRGRATFTVYWKITDFLLSVPIFGDLLKPYLPMLGYFCLITL